MSKGKPKTEQTKPSRTKAPKKGAATEDTQNKAPGVTRNTSKAVEAPSDTPEPSEALDGKYGTPDGPEGKKPSGAPKGNRNAIRHGLKSGKLPANSAYIEIQMNSLRRQLEDATLEVKKEISIGDAAAIQTAVKWERHGALALRWLRMEEKNLKPLERLQFSREIARASTERDKAIAALELEYYQDNAPPWAEDEDD